MFPWYSGTSADLVHTLFGMIVSLKVFLGRFDLRALHAALGGGAGARAVVSSGGGCAAAAAGGSGCPSCGCFNSASPPPADGDGLTFEHLASRDSIWLDFIADTGDGGDSTYAVARALAAPRLAVAVPPALAARLPRRSAAALAAAASVSVSASASAGSAPAAASSSPPLASADLETRVLPRGDVLVIGGDLAYPHPSSETYVRRLLVPFEAALPPPPGAAAADGGGGVVLAKPRLRKQPNSSGSGSSSSLTMNLSPPPHAGPAVFALPGNHGQSSPVEFVRERSEREREAREDEQRKKVQKNSLFPSLFKKKIKKKLQTGSTASRRMTPSCSAGAGSEAGPCPKNAPTSPSGSRRAGGSWPSTPP